MTFKLCSICGKEKDELEFGKNRLQCKYCIKQYKKQYAIDNKEIIKEWKANYYQENKEIIADKNKIYYENNKSEILALC
jgi:hypothetical protein